MLSRRRRGVSVRVRQPSGGFPSGIRHPGRGLTLEFRFSRYGARVSSIEERLRDLEARVAALEGGSPSAEPAGDESGRLVYGGEASFGRHRWRWEMARSPGRLVRHPPEQLAAVLAAAGHPARLRILQLLVQGPRPIAELQAELSLASQGQLYHHLKTLTAARLVEQPERGVYRVPPTAVFPVLALAAAALDVARQE